MTLLLPETNFLPESLSTSNIDDLNTQQSLADSSALIDSWSRELSYLRLSITDFCNFSCEYCLPDGYQGKRPTNELTVAEIEILAAVAADLGIRKIRLTGGEPSIRRDLSDIITVIADAGIEEIALTTNGYRLGRWYQDWIAAGLQQINISIDSFDAEVFAQITGHDMLPQLLADIDKVLEDGRLSVKINGVLQSQYAQSTLTDALAYIKDRSVTYRFIELMQTSDNQKLFFAEHAAATQMRDYMLSSGWQALVRKQTAGPAIEYSHADYQGRLGLIAPYAPRFCHSCNRMRINAQGQVHLCLFDSQVHDIRHHLQTGDREALRTDLLRLMPVKPEHHHLHDADSGIMTNLSLVGG